MTFEAAVVIGLTFDLVLKFDLSILCIQTLEAVENVWTCQKCVFSEILLTKYNKNLLQFNKLPTTPSCIQLKNYCFDSFNADLKIRLRFQLRQFSNGNPK